MGGWASVRCIHTWTSIRLVASPSRPMLPTKPARLLVWPNTLFTSHRTRYSTKKQWITRHSTDKFVRLARQDAFRSRSAYKLCQLDEKHNIVNRFRRKSIVIDLGAAPGGWSQVIGQRIKNGCVLAVDLLEMDPIDNVTFIQGDFTSALLQHHIKAFIESKPNYIVSAVVSDMSPNISGIKSRDHQASLDLVSAAWLLAKERLEIGGSFVAKIFQGGQEEDFKSELASQFAKIVWAKPEASRQSSSERYLVCLGRLGASKQE